MRQPAHVSVEPCQTARVRRLTWLYTDSQVFAWLKFEDHSVSVDHLILIWIKCLRRVTRKKYLRTSASSSDPDQPAHMAVLLDHTVRYASIIFEKLRDTIWQFFRSNVSRSGWLRSPLVADVRRYIFAWREHNYEVRREKGVLWTCMTYHARAVHVGWSGPMLVADVRKTILSYRESYSTCMSRVVQK